MEHFSHNPTLRKENLSLTERRNKQKKMIKMTAQKLI
jgi:hypothetical protein